MKKRASQAFTLVELMTAIVILGILAAVAVMSYGMYVKKARVAEAYTGLDNLGKSEITYFLQHKVFNSYQSTQNIMTYSTVYDPQNYYVIENVQPYNDTLYSPFPLGTRARFWFQAVAYKADGTGAMSSGTTPGGQFFSTGVNMSMWGRSGWCSNRTGTNMMPPVQPHYQQVVLRTFYDFKLETENLCTGIDKRIYTDTNGKLAQGPFFEYALGK